MKNLAKIFVAVVALFAYSCATDTTEDLGVKFGGQTEITLSLEESRTQLGAKAEGVYPLYWSEGDAIAVNGVASAALTAEQAGSDKATFAVDGALTAPYCIAYPAAPAGQVLFAENQTHVGNTTFGSGISTMYAYGAATGAELHHLTGVLKIGVVGLAKLTYAQISTIDRAPIAGVFDFDFEKGEATATTESKSVINYSFGEGVDLSSEATYIHVAVPAGEYNELYVTLYDAEGGVMYATVKAGESKPLTAGKVRTFTENISYSPNTSVVVIRDVASLKAFASDVTTGEGVLAQDVLLVADVDMSGEEWTSLTWNAVGEAADGAPMKHTFYGNGFAIKGLNAPLFDILTADVKGLHLEDVNISSTATYAGAFANQLCGVVSNCSASGVINYDSAAAGAFVGGIAGIAMDGASFYNAVNHCEINATKNHQLLYPGGICGCIGAAASSVINNVVVFDNCHNKGNINILPGKGSTSRNTYGGGILGSYHKPLTMTNCSNSGNVEHQAVNTKNSNLGGLIGRTYTASKIIIKNCKNSGNITTNATCSENGVVGGCFGLLNGLTDCEIENISNSGTVTVSGTALKDGKSLYGGGVFGQVTVFPAGSKVSNLTNSGKVVLNGAAAAAVVGGGIFGYMKAESLTIDGFTNNGEIESTATAGTYLACGGCIGKFDGAANLPATFTNISNSANVTVGGSIGTSTYLGGISGLFCGHETKGYVNVTNAVNTATATITMKGDTATNGATADVPYVGGLFGKDQYCNLSNVTNNGQVVWSEEGVATKAKGGIEFMVGGVTGQHFYGNIDGCYNNGAVTMLADNNPHHHHVGGVFGQVNCYSASCKNIVNKGNIHLTSTFGPKRCRVGGVAGVLYRTDLHDATNEGNITYDALEMSNQMFIAGGVGYAYTGSGDDIDLIRVKNKGRITINKGTAALGSSIRIAGIVGYYNADLENCEISECVNIGDIEVNFEKAYTSVGVCGIAGMLESGMEIKNCEQYSNLKAMGYPGKVKAIIGNPRQEYSETTSTNDKGEEVVTKTLAVIVNGCKLGGTITTEMTTLENSAGETVTEPKVVTIDESNFFDYIYGGETAWQDEWNYDGCSALEVKPVF